MQPEYVMGECLYSWVFTKTSRAPTVNIDSLGRGITHRTGGGNTQCFHQAEPITGF